MMPGKGGLIRRGAQAPAGAASAFTLVELLVVMGILAILISLLTPVIHKARAGAQRTACAAHLHDIGSQFQMYLNDSARGRLPRVNTMPSLRPLLNDAPPIADVLQPYTRGAVEVLRCPADRIIAESPGCPGGFATYYDREGSSFQYSPWLSAMHAGDQINDVQLYKQGRQDVLPLFSDYESFHGPAGQPGSTNYLFADWHVGDINIGK